MKYLLPNDTVPLVRSRFDQCLNLALLLGRYVTLEAIDRDQFGPGPRAEWLKSIPSRFNGKNIGGSVTAYHTRWKQMIKAAEAHSWHMKLRTRLIVGLGGKGALEIGITLDKVTGLPYIPGSALKGLCRSFALYEIAAKHGIDPQQEKALEKLDEALATGKNYNGDAKVYADCFGSQEDAGALIFFDGVVQALPNGKSLFALDVMTPHFPKYYRDNGQSAPADNDSPNPVNFITVAHGTTFAFAVGIRHGQRDQDTQDLRDTAVKWLQQALEDFGVGSKTAAGYGAFQPS